MPTTYTKGERRPSPSGLPCRRCGATMCSVLRLRLARPEQPLVRENEVQGGGGERRMRAVLGGGAAVAAAAAAAGLRICHRLCRAHAVATGAAARHCHRLCCATAACDSRSPLLENDSSEGDLLFASQEFGRPLPIERCVLAGYQRCPRPSLMGVWTPFYVYLLGVWTPFYFYLLGVSRPSSLLLIRCPDTLLCPVSRKEGF